MDEVNKEGMMEMGGCMKRILMDRARFLGGSAVLEGGGGAR